MAKPVLFWTALKEMHDETSKRVIFYESSRFFGYVDQYITKKKTLSEAENIIIEKASSEDYCNRLQNVSETEHRLPIRKARRRKPTKEDVLKWFFDNYEDPANGVPYISAEGGYQYFNGGPYDPDEEIQQEYPNIDMQVLQEVLNEIYPQGTEWVMKEQY